MTDEVSPYNYFQERYRHDEWRLLCCVICLNLTTGRALESVHTGLFERFPDPLEMASALLDPTVMEELVGLLAPLGLQRRRALNLARMSMAYLSWDPSDDVSLLPGIGKYGRDSHDIFIRRVVPDDVRDKELRRYLLWYQDRERWFERVLTMARWSRYGLIIRPDYYGLAALAAV